MLQEFGERIVVQIAGRTRDTILEENPQVSDMFPKRRLEEVAAQTAEVQCLDCGRVRRITGPLWSTERFSERIGDKIINRPVPRFSKKSPKRFSRRSDLCRASASIWGKRLSRC